MKICMRCAAGFSDPTWTCPSCGFAPETIDSVTRFSRPVGKDGFNPAAFDRLAELEDHSFWFCARSRLIDWALGSYFPYARSLLEIGCGTGFVLEGLRRTRPHWRFVGADLHYEGLVHASRRLPGLDLLQCDARRLPFRDEFDVVGAFDMLEHVDEDRRVLGEMYAAVKPGGGLLLTTPQHPWLWSTSDEYAEHQRRYRRVDLVLKISAAGFRIRRVTSFVTLLLPAMAAIRLKARLGPPPVDPNREHVIARRVTRPLEWVLDLERVLITRGVDLPVGGSLLVAADRPV